MSSGKIAVIVDESTTLSHKSVMTVHIKVALENDEPILIFLDLVELESLKAEALLAAMLLCLKSAGFNDEYLKTNWIAFVSDGASVLVGKNFGCSNSSL